MPAGRRRDLTARTRPPGAAAPGLDLAYPLDAAGNRLYYNPGIPEVREFVQDAMMDAVNRYDIDGVHFDDYFYPVPSGTTRCSDDATFAAYGAGFTDRADWRRDNVDLLVQEMQQRDQGGQAVGEVRGQPVRHLAQPGHRPARLGHHRQPVVRHISADTRGWVKKGWLDYIVPQLYWYIGQYPAADYAKLVPWWAERGGGHRRAALDRPGRLQGRRSGPGSPAVVPAGRALRHLTLNRDNPQVGGDIWYNSGDVREDRLGSVSTVVTDHYTRPALAPLLPRLAGGRAPRRPVAGHAPAGWPGVPNCTSSPPEGTSRSSSRSSGSTGRPDPVTSPTPGTWSRSSPRAATCAGWIPGEPGRELLRDGRATGQTARANPATAASPLTGVTEDSQRRKPRSAMPIWAFPRVRRQGLEPRTR